MVLSAGSSPSPVGSISKSPTRREHDADRIQRIQQDYKGLLSYVFRRPWQTAMPADGYNADLEPPEWLSYEGSWR